VSREDLIRFARRDWAAAAQAKDQHWLREKQRSAGPDDCRRLEDMLQHVRAAGRAAASKAERLSDIDVHARVGLALRAAGALEVLKLVDAAGTGGAALRL
jgi:hypothetical protein